MFTQSKLLFTVGPPYTLRLKVKFYSSEPNLLREELTRYQFFLQLKQDILDGKLECPDNVTIELAALALQCEYLLTLLDGNVRISILIVRLNVVSIYSCSNPEVSSNSIYFEFVILNNGDLVSLLLVTHDDVIFV